MNQTMMQLQLEKVSNCIIGAPVSPRVEEQYLDPSSPMSNSEKNTMAEGAALMRELDADILEQGVVDSCSTGKSPLLVRLDLQCSLSEESEALTLPPSIIEQSDQALDTSSSTNAFTTSHADGRKDDNGDVKIMSERTEQSLPLHITTQPAHLNGTDSANPPLPPRVVVRRCLSGEERPYSVDEKPQQNPLDINEVVAVCPIPAIDQEIVKELVNITIEPNTLEKSIEEEETRTTMTRSKSRERLFREAIQFAEAVGELPPTESDIHQIIEESGSESDDDGDAKEIRVDDRAQILTPTSPRKPTGPNPVSPLPRKKVNVAVDLVKDTHLKINVSNGANPKSPRRFSSRWLFKPAKKKSHAFLYSLPEQVEKEEYQYKGISANPPEITKRGIARGNYAQLHRKAWLEVSDKYHRYGKNLRIYYKHWVGSGYPTNSFFNWLDSKGEAAGLPLPNLEECPRLELDSDTVLYINNEKTQQQYELSIVPDENGRAILVDLDELAVLTGSDGWILVLRDHKIYGAEKVTSINGHCKQRFHHSSFFSGKAVAAAGIIITDDEGVVTRFYPHSGHYRPGEAHVQRMLFYLHHCGVALRTFQVDTQQIFHVNRKDILVPEQVGEEKEKKKKIQSLHLKPAVYVACYLAHKARFIELGVFAMMHKIRKANVASVTEALCAVDGGGYWKKLRLELAVE